MDTPLLQRREFLAASGAFTLGLSLSGGRAEAATAKAVNAWLSVGSDNSVTLTIGASDMGQGSFQALAQVLAEDLMVDPLRVKLVQGGPTMIAPTPVGSAINTVGSSVTRSNYWKMRDAGAVARETLVQAAMNLKGDAQRGNYGVTDGVVHHTSGWTRSYGQLAAAAALLTPPATAALVPDASCGRSAGRCHARTSRPRSTAARSMASTCACRAWCSPSSSTARPSAARWWARRRNRRARSRWCR